MSTDVTDFFDGTTAVFVPADEPARHPDFMSASGSRYWYVPDGVYRSSDHWGNAIASCHWFLGPTFDVMETVTRHEPTCGFCRWNGFARDPDESVLDHMYAAQKAERMSHWSPEQLAKVEALEAMGAVCC